MLWSSIASANTNPFIFEKISNKEGLNQNSITSLFQDRTGFIWMGTSNGLIKHDGYSFQSYVPHPGDTTSLLNNLVMKVFEDKNETLWIGTQGGLCFYPKNKDRFVWVKTFNDLIEKPIIFNDIVETKDGNIWLATSSGLFVLTILDFDNNKIQVQKITSNTNGNNLFEPNTAFNSIHELEDNSVLIGTSQGLFHLKKDKKNKLILAKELNPTKGISFNITEIYQDKNGLVWLGTMNGLQFLKVNINQENYQYDWLKKPKFFTESLNLNGSIITALTETENGFVLIGTSLNGLFTFFKNDGRLEHYRQSPKKINSISSNVINDIITDESGVIWIATGHGGVNKVDLNRKPFFNLTKQEFNNSSLSSKLISGVFMDSREHLWVGSFKEGVNISKKPFDFSTKNETEFNHFLKNLTISCIHETPEGLIILGTSKGIKIYNLKQNKFVELSNNHPFKEIFKDEYIYSFLQVGNEIWLSSSKKLSKIILKNSSLDLITGDFIYEKIDNSLHRNFKNAPKGVVNIMMNDPKTGVWFGTKNGLYLLPNKKGQTTFEIFRHNINQDSSISHNSIFSLYRDKKTDNLWVGTFGGGLNKILFNNENEVVGFQRFTKRNGLPDNAVYSILEDKKGCLWLSTDEGIVKINSTTFEVKKYNMEDGLPANNFRKNSSFFVDDIIMMGSLNGLTIFKPTKIIENPYPPKSIITNFRLFNELVQPNQKFRGQVILDKPISKTEVITLPYNFNQITFEFTTMHYAASNKNTFEYILEGVDKDWVSVDSKQRFANYSQLRPGTYIFKLKSYNGDGLESSEIQEIEIIINQPYYWTIWAKILYMLLVGILGYFIFGYLNYTLELRRQIASEEREKAHIKEINEAKLKFFTDISHEFRTPLTLIISPLERVLHDKRLHPELKERITSINKNGQILLNLTNTLIDFRQVEEGQLKLEVAKGNLANFIQKITVAFQEYAKDKQIDFQIQVPTETVLCWFDPTIIERVLFNLLSNSFKYTDEYGSVVVTLDFEKENHATIKVIDTGKGMTEKEVNNIFDRYFHGKYKKSLFGSSGIGLSLVKKLIELHHGEIKVVSVPEEGSVFEVSIPIEKQYYNIDKSYDSGEKPMITTVDEKVKVIPKLTDETSSTTEKQTLLIVEDNIEIQEFIESIFKDKFQVFKANNGELGLALAFQLIPNIIISDVMMPKMDGFELSQQLKNDIRTSHIPLILLTALNDFESKKTAFEQGGDIYISKPFSPQLLELQISNLLKTKEKEAEYFRKQLLMQPKLPQLEMSRDDVFLQTIKEFIENNYKESELNVEALAKESHLSYIQFYRKFKALTGVNAKEYIRTFRLKKAAHILENTSSKSIGEVMYSVGFSSQSYFTNAFKKEYGMTPNQYKKKFN